METAVIKAILCYHVVNGSVLIKVMFSLAVLWLYHTPVFTAASYTLHLHALQKLEIKQCHCVCLMQKLH